MTLFDFGKRIEEIRTAADCVEIKGSQNRKLIDFIVNTCNGLIQEINDAVRNAKTSSDQQKEGDCDGHDPGESKQD